MSAGFAGEPLRFGIGLPTHAAVAGTWRMTRPGKCDFRTKSVCGAGNGLDE